MVWCDTVLYETVPYVLREMIPPGTEKCAV
jgi:hypothetical protein